MNMPNIGKPRTLLASAIVVALALALFMCAFVCKAYANESGGNVQQAVSSVVENSGGDDFDDSDIYEYLDGFGSEDEGFGDDVVSQGKAKGYFGEDDEAGEGDEEASDDDLLVDGDDESDDSDGIDEDESDFDDEGLYDDEELDDEWLDDDEGEWIDGVDEDDEWLDDDDDEWLDDDEDGEWVYEDDEWLDEDDDDEWLDDDEDDEWLDEDDGEWLEDDDDEWADDEDGEWADDEDGEWLYLFDDAEIDGEVGSAYYDCASCTYGEGEIAVKGSMASVDAPMPLASGIAASAARGSSVSAKGDAADAGKNSAVAENAQGRAESENAQGRAESDDALVAEQPTWSYDASPSWDYSWNTGEADAGGYAAMIDDPETTTSDAGEPPMTRNPLHALAGKALFFVKMPHLAVSDFIFKGVMATGAIGDVTFENVSEGFVAKSFSVDENGMVTVPRGTPGGSYVITVKVNAHGDSAHEPASSEVAFIVRVA